MNKNPKISVIMSAYNSEKYIQKAIESILKQTFSDFEFIIIDDWSFDNTWKIIKDFEKEDSRIIFIKNEKNLWIYKSLNKWLEISKWEYIAIMDSDDISFLDRFEKQINFLEKNKNIWLLWWQYKIIDSEWKIVWEKKYPLKDFEKYIFFRNPIWHPSIMIRKKCFLDLWFYDDSFFYAEDLELFLRFSQKYKSENLNDFLLFYRIHSSNSIIKKQKIMIKETLKIRKKAIKMWYKMNIKAKIFYFITFLSLFFPSKFIFKIFNFFIKK